MYCFSVSPSAAKTCVDFYYAELIFSRTTSASVMKISSRTCLEELSSKSSSTVRLDLQSYASPTLHFCVSLRLFSYFAEYLRFELNTTSLFNNVLI